MVQPHIGYISDLTKNHGVRDRKKNALTNLERSKTFIGDL